MERGRERERGRVLGDGLLAAGPRALRGGRGVRRVPPPQARGQHHDHGDRWGEGESYEEFTGLAETRLAQNS